MIAELSDFTAEKEFQAIQNIMWKYDVAFSILYLLKLQARNEFTMYR